MRDVVDQVRREADRLYVREGVRVVSVRLGDSLYGALESWVSGGSSFVDRTGPGPFRTGGLVFQRDGLLTGGKVLLLDRSGQVAGWHEVSLPSGHIAFPSKADAAKYISMPPSFDPDDTVIHTTPVSKKITVDPKAVYGASTLGSKDLHDAMAAVNRQLWYDLMRSYAHMVAWPPAVLFGHKEEQGPAAPLPVRQQAEGIVAYRTWHLVEHEPGDWRLKSVTADQVWDGPILRADAPPSDQKPPVEGGHTGHGIYAWKNELRARPASGEFMDYCTVAGEVELRGRVVVHEGGYRAERARILGLTLAPAPKPFEYPAALIRSLEERYHCDVNVEANNGHR